MLKNTNLASGEKKELVLFKFSGDKILSWHLKKIIWILCLFFILGCKVNS